VRFLGERGLTDTQIATIKTWADAGCPEGDPKDEPPLALISRGLAARPARPDRQDARIPTPCRRMGRTSTRAFVVPVEIPRRQVRPGGRVSPGKSQGGASRRPDNMGPCLYREEAVGRAEGRRARLQDRPGRARDAPAGAPGIWVPGKIRCRCQRASPCPGRRMPTCSCSSPASHRQGRNRAVVDWLLPDRQDADRRPAGRHHLHNKVDIPPAKRTTG